MSHVTVVTCAHRGDDARISYRQIAAMLETGLHVTLVAPGPTPLEKQNFSHKQIERAVGIARAQSWKQAFRLLRQHRRNVILFHDIELLPLVLLAGCKKIIWDVHEDYIRVIQDRKWIKKWMAGPFIVAVRLMNLLGKKTCDIIVAEKSYLKRFPNGTLVRNVTNVPPIEGLDVGIENRAIYVGRISRSRGLYEMIELGKLSAGSYVVELVGDVDRSDAHLLSEASRQGHVRWGGFLQNELALQRIEHALVGLSLLRPYSNFTQSLPTKNFEYMSRGVPVIASRLGVADESVEASGGFLSDQGDIRSIDLFIRGLIADPNSRLKLGAEAHSFVMQEFNWEHEKDIFLSKIREVLDR